MCYELPRDQLGTEMARSFYFALLCVGCWRSFVTANDPCIPEVRGQPFVQYVENNNCEVDEKLLQLFDPVSFSEFVAKRLTANFICTGFIDVLNLSRDSTLENLCVLGLLSDIRDTDFCSDTKMMRVLEEVIDSAVFKKISKKVANFTRQHCNIICNSSNEMCWAFGITAKLVLKQSVMSTTAPTTEPTTAPTTEPTTATVSLPDLFTTKSPHTPDGNDDDATDKPADVTFGEDDKTTVEQDEQLLNNAVNQDIEDGNKELGNGTENVEKQEVSATTSASDTKGKS